MITVEQLDALWDKISLKQTVSYIPYDTVTDAMIAGETVTDIDAMYQMVTKFEEQLGEGAGAFRQLRTWNLRASHLTVAPTKRGIIQEADGNQWGISDVEIKSAGTRYKCDCYWLGVAVEEV